MIGGENDDGDYVDDAFTSNWTNPDKPVEITRIYVAYQNHTQSYSFLVCSLQSLINSTTHIIGRILNLTCPKRIHLQNECRFTGVITLFSFKLSMEIKPMQKNLASQWNAQNGRSARDMAKNVQHKHERERTFPMTNTISYTHVDKLCPVGLVCFIKSQRSPKILCTALDLRGSSK